MTGWTAPWVALATMLIGLLLMLREQLDRLGSYWSAEAIVGAELLLLSLQVGTFLWTIDSVDWVPRVDGLHGGMVGWAIGTLLLAAFGRWPGFAIVFLLGATGLYYLMRYTPMIYLIPFVNHLFPFRTPAPERRQHPRHQAKAASTEDVAHFSQREWLTKSAATVGYWLRTATSQLAHILPTPQSQNEHRSSSAQQADAANFVAPQHHRRDNLTVGAEARARQAARPVARPVARMVRPTAGDAPSRRADHAEQAPVRRHTAAEAGVSPRNARQSASQQSTPQQSSQQKKGSAPKKRTKKAKKADTTPSLPAGMAPSIELLTADQGVYEAVDMQQIQELIENTLEDFNVPVEVVHVESGPTVTQFGVAPLYLERGGQRRKVRVNRIVSLADDLALALAVPAVRIEAPVPGRAYVGIEVPNTEKVTVSLRGVIESAAFQKDGGRLPLPLGRNTAGAGVVMDLTRAPHMLIAGSTGSGKSVCINTIITGLLMRYGPESLRFVMVDPKMVELPGYNNIPHMIGKVITEMDQVMGALTWLLLEMDDRYQAFKAVGVRNVEAYNALSGKKPKKGEDPINPYPYIVLVIDELADLMMTSADDIERQLCRLAQMARATGIHLIIATQRPSTDVVTGLIKANFPTRIAFSVTSQIDSRVILDTVGAERLLGRGDMLLMRPDMAKLQRVQGCLVTDPEINNVVAFWKKQVATDAPPTVAPWTGLLDQMDDEDGLIHDAIDVLRELESCSTSMLQRKLKIGYPKAARLMEDLEKKGVVGPDMGGGQGREVLLKKEEDEGDGEDEVEEPMF